MRTPPMQNGFFEGNPIDTGDMITTREDVSDGWLLSAPSTTVISRVQISPPKAHSEPRLQKAAMASQSASEQRRLSTASENSNPGMTEGSSASDSEASFDDDHNSHVDQARELLWNSYFADDYSQPKDYGQARSGSSTPRLQIPKSFPGRKLAVSDHAYANAISSPPKTQNSPIGSPSLRPSDRAYFNALGSPRSQRSPLASPSLRPQIGPQPTYTPFPPTSRSPTRPSDSMHTPSKSWPVRGVSRPARPAMRPRAQTSPTNMQHVQQVRINTPSKLSHCNTPLEENMSTSGAGPSLGATSSLHMRSVPSSPRFEPEDLMDSMGSYLDLDDDDDEDEEEKSVLEALATKLRIGRSTSGASGMSNPGRPTVVDDPSNKGLKESFRKISSGVKGVFRIKK